MKEAQNFSLYYFLKVYVMVSFYIILCAVYYFVFYLFKVNDKIAHQKLHSS